MEEILTFCSTRYNMTFEGIRQDRGVIGQLVAVVCSADYD